ncbi:MAG: hypothetical protein EXR65_02225 [Dehalococcoidia bacterium]|nr:hypothetical protein [Dehalococcoidia bacterium]
MRSRARAARHSTPLVLAAVFLLASALWAGLFARRDAGIRFDPVRWELSTVAGKWLFVLGAPLRSDPDPDAAIARYFALADRESPEGQRLEGVVEAAIAGRIDAVLRERGVRGRLAPGGPLAVWPPVDIELAGSPLVLAVSPRARIALVRIELLRADVPAAVAVALEARTEADDPPRSALVVGTGGFSMYPAVVSNRSGYAQTVQTAAHEWVHHYLAFYPLGFGQPHGARLTINETVADLAGEEIARRVIERFGDPTARAAPAATPPTAPPGIDRDRVLRELRLEVDALLAADRVADAEARMEQVRQELERGGVHIRRLNQAYFAWFGSYAARSDAVDPLGGQLRGLRERASSLAQFLAAVRGTTSRAEVEALASR